MTLILAGCAQDKGRIERLRGTFQDRTGQRAKTKHKRRPKTQAQAVLERYLPEHNLKFAKPPANAIARLEESRKLLAERMGTRVNLSVQSRQIVYNISSWSCGAWLSAVG